MLALNNIRPHIHASLHLPLSRTQILLTTIIDFIRMNCHRRSHPSLILPSILPNPPRIKRLMHHSLLPTQTRTRSSLSSALFAPQATILSQTTYGALLHSQCLRSSSLSLFVNICMFDSHCLLVLCCLWASLVHLLIHYPSAPYSNRSRSTTPTQLPLIIIALSL